MALLRDVLVVILGLSALCLGNEAALEAVMERMEKDVLSFAAEVEKASLGRCSDETLALCYANSYSDCLSEFPNQICPGGDMTVPECGGTTPCAGSLLDYTVSAVRLPSDVADGRNGNPTDVEVSAVTTQLQNMQLLVYMMKKQPVSLDLLSISN